MTGKEPADVQDIHNFRSQVTYHPKRKNLAGAIFAWVGFSVIAAITISIGSLVVLGVVKLWMLALHIN